MKAENMTIEDCQKTAQKMWIVFSDQIGLPWLRLLRKGYRHCFVLIYDGKNWISVDPMAHYMDIIVHQIDGEFDFPTWLAGRGHIVVPASFECHAPRPCPFMPFSCVEVCKRILGTRRRLIITPWALYKHITREERYVDTRSLSARIKDNLKHLIRKGAKLWEA